jgi:hypothetical protein
MNMKKLQLFFSIALFSNSLFSQCFKPECDSSNYIHYYNLVSEGKYYAYENNPDKAIPFFLNAFKLVPKVFAFDKFHLARCYAMKQDTAQVMHWLLQAIKEGFFYKYNKETRSDSLFLFLDSKKAQIIATADEDAFKYYNDTDAKENKWNDSIQYYFYNDAVFHSAHNKAQAEKKGKKYIDTTLKDRSLLQDMLVNFILTNGYPGRLTAPFADILSVPLWHLTVDRKIKLKPFLYKELKRGNITPDDYGGFCDLIELKKEDPKCLYFVLHTNCPSSEWLTLINNRKSIGLSIFLDQGDYISYQMKRRKKLPWVVNSNN